MNAAEFSLWRRFKFYTSAKRTLVPPKMSQRRANRQINFSASSVTSSNPTLNFAPARVSRRNGRPDGQVGLTVPGQCARARPPVHGMIKKSAQYGKLLKVCPAKWSLLHFLPRSVTQIFFAAATQLNPAPQPFLPTAFDPVVASRFQSPAFVKPNWVTMTCGRPPSSQSRAFRALMRADLQSAGIGLRWAHTLHFVAVGRHDDVASRFRPACL